MWTSNKINTVLFVLTLCVYSAAYSQPMIDDAGYYLFPIKPGVRNTLAGTMGELRSTHFHTGIDIRTEGREGLAVFAAADGYVTRIAVSPTGYGNALYLLHPNGQTTVYAHLKSFPKRIAEFVMDEQYRKQSFTINAFPRANQFEYSQGDTIAISGNSGSSGGPHLHFDIRDKNQDLLNPLSYGFNEVIDTRSPIVRSIALRTKSTDSRVNGQFGRLRFQAEADQSNFKISDTIEAVGNIALELLAWDRMNGTRFHTGINSIHVSVNDNLIFGESINTWPFSKSRHFYKYINYASLVEDQKRFHKLYIDDGNQLNFYSPVINNGILIIEPEHFYDVFIEMKDSYGNQSNLSFIIEGKADDNLPVETINKESGIEIMENVLVFYSDPMDSAVTGTVYINGIQQKINADYYDNNCQATFIWQLTRIPDSVKIGSHMFHSNLISLVPPGREFSVFNSIADVVFSKSSLFDTLALTLDYKIDSSANIELLSLGEVTTPLKREIEVRFKPKLIYDDWSKYAIYQVYGRNNYAFVGGEWSKDRIAFKTRNFGKFTLLSDTISPTIKPLIINKNSIVFKIGDKLSGVKKITASIDDKWLLMSYDPKKQQIWAIAHMNSGNTFKGKLVLSITDNAGNEKTYSTKL